MLRIAITRCDGVVTFSPDPGQVNTAQDKSFIFLNEDSEEHQPNPVDAAARGVWFETPIAAGTPEHPTPSILNSDNRPGTVDYVCAICKQTGTIVFT